MASSDHFILNSEVKMLPAGQVQKASRTVFEIAHAINYRQTMPEDRFTLAKMNVTRSWNHDYQ